MTDEPTGPTGNDDRLDPAAQPAPEAEPSFEPEPVAIAAAPAVDAEADLRDAVGLPPPRVPPPAPAPTSDYATDRDLDLDYEPGAPRRRQRIWAVVALLALVGLAAAALAIAGRIHAGRYRLACRADAIVAERGRSFPPWGMAALTGPDWAPIPIPPQAECQSRDTDEPAVLEEWFLVALTSQATAKLTAPGPGDVDAAEALLAQALLHTRAPERRDRRTEIERLQGDVAYWRAVGRVKQAAEALDAAAKGFDDAAARKPRHAIDPEAWAAYARRMRDQLNAGPGGVAPTAEAPATPPSHEPAPPGVALPLDQPETAPSTTAPAPPDASVPGGGVLL